MNFLRDEAEWRSRDVTLSERLEEAAKMNGFQYEIELCGSLLFNLFGERFSAFTRYLPLKVRCKFSTIRRFARNVVEEFAGEAFLSGNAEQRACHK